MKIPQQISNIKIENFDYPLPDEQVAKYPLDQRDESKLLVWKGGNISDNQFIELPDLLPARSKLIFNNTRVIRARLHFRKETGAKIEVFVLDPFLPADYALNFQQTEKCSWKCMVGNLKKWKNEKMTLSVTINNNTITLYAENMGEAGNSRIVQFSWNKNEYSFSEVLEAAGTIPIPPYLHRESETIDLTRYQTVFSKIKGSVAAPTAGLHFTDRVIGQLQQKGVTTAELTLHVGAGTFQPVKSNTIDGHEMHTEHFLVNRKIVEELTNHDAPVIAVGTTAVRTLESLFYLGEKVLNNPKTDPADLTVKQWEPYQQTNSSDRKASLAALLDYMNRNELEQLSSSTQIIIVPGYNFKMIDGMITNFHQPQSTLLLLISAFIGDEWKSVYQHALSSNYRFLSYGDSNLYLK